MNSKVLLKRIAVLMLTAVMTLSMTGFAFGDVFADSVDSGDVSLTTEEADAAANAALEEGEDAEKEEPAQSADVQESSESSDGTDSPETQNAYEETVPESTDSGEDVLTEETQDEEQTGSRSEQVEDEENGSETGRVNTAVTKIGTDSKETAAQGNTEKITGLELMELAAGESGTVNAKIKWDEFKDAVSYNVSISKSGEPDALDDTDQTEYQFKDLDKGVKYTVTITALGSGDDSEDEKKPIASGNFELCTYVTNFISCGSKEELKYTAGQVKYNNILVLSWDTVPGADSYTVTKKVTAPDGSEIKDVQKKESQMTVDVSAVSEKKSGSVEKLEATFENLYPGRKYTFTVTANSGDTAIIESLPDDMKNIQPKLGALQGRSRSSATLSPGKIKFADGGYDLRSYAGQARNGWGVAQGGASDGTFAYVLLANSYKQTGRIAKFRISNSAIAKVSDTLETTHGNGMTYDSRRHKLVVIGRNDSVRGNHKQEVTVIDAESLTIVRQQNLNYSYFSDDSTYFDSDQRGRGLAAIAYSPKYDVYVAKQRDYNNLIIIDPDTLKAIGLVKTLVNQYGGSGQAMDGDDQFVYMLKSGYGSSNTNIVLTLDWNSNRLIDPETGFRREFVGEEWGCNNNLYPVAMYTINTPNEAENVYHYYDNSGREIFYMTEYDANQQYNITKTQKAYKAKWKKVKKKVKVKKTKKVKKKVKWKKVKTKKGKYKWKYKKKKVKVTYYKWKKKKVWLYKTKYKTITTKTPTYKDRRDYVYYLGII